MTESERISDLFEKLYNGEPWIDVNMVSTLNNITADQAAKSVLPNCNSIWEIVHHLIEWRLNVLQRVHGNIIQTPSHNYVEVIKNPSNAAWAETLQKLETTQMQWLEFLKMFQTQDFEKRYPVNNRTYYEHIQGIIQHDAYHLGQIVLLAKLTRNANWI
jgi:uncharacterized damage-inducible protein DinB